MTTPTSMFKDGLMRKPNKAQLKSFLIDNKVPDCQPKGTFIIDGGALLHKVVWVRGETYLETVNHYVKFVRVRYGWDASIVFDGYNRYNSSRNKVEIR